MDSKLQHHPVPEEQVQRIKEEFADLVRTKDESSPNSKRRKSKSPPKKGKKTAESSPAGSPAVKKSPSKSPSQKGNKKKQGTGKKKKLDKLPERLNEDSDDEAPAQAVDPPPGQPRFKPTQPSASPRERSHEVVVEASASPALGEKGKKKGKNKTSTKGLSSSRGAQDVEDSFVRQVKELDEVLQRGSGDPPVFEDEADPRSSSGGRLRPEDSLNQSNKHGSMPAYTTKNSRRSSKHLSRAPSKTSKHSKQSKQARKSNKKLH